MKNKRQINFFEVLFQISNQTSSPAASINAFCLVITDGYGYPAMASKGRDSVRAVIVGGTRYYFASDA